MLPCARSGYGGGGGGAHSEIYGCGNFNGIAKVLDTLFHF